MNAANMEPQKAGTFKNCIAWICALLGVVAVIGASPCFAQALFESCTEQASAALGLGEYSFASNTDAKSCISKSPSVLSKAKEKGRMKLKEGTIELVNRKREECLQINPACKFEHLIDDNEFLPMVRISCWGDKANPKNASVQYQGVVTTRCCCPA